MEGTGSVTGDACVLRKPAGNERKVEAEASQTWGGTVLGVVGKNKEAG